MYARATIAGNIGKDVETRQVGQNTVHNFSVATSRARRDEKKTTWWRVTAWGDRWNGVLPFLKKGTGVIVEGDVELSEYEADDGTVRTNLNLTASTITLLPRSASADNNNSSKQDDDDGWENIDF